MPWIMGKMRFDILKPSFFWWRFMCFSHVGAFHKWFAPPKNWCFSSWKILPKKRWGGYPPWCRKPPWAKAKRFELLFPEEKVGFWRIPHLLVSKLRFSGMEHIWRFQLQTNLDVNDIYNDWVLPLKKRTCECYWEKIDVHWPNWARRTCESRKEDRSMNTEILCQEKGGLRILQSFGHNTFLYIFVGFYTSILLTFGW